MQRIYQQARLSRDRRFDGRFFVAVKTTGIFCRPICPANLPKEENIEYFQTAHQASEAGYRPCLRCRPDSAPGSCAWQGVMTTVRRAMNLLQQDMHSSVEAIAERLGIGERHLRQLFQRELGVSPKQYQLYERLLFAKQLLQQSRLTVEHVAQASGFSSSRALQANLHKRWQLSAGQLRHSTKYTEEEYLVLKLYFRPPYNWERVRDFWAMRAIPDVERVTEDSYSRFFEWMGESGWFEMRYMESKSCFELRLHYGVHQYLKSVLENIRRMFDLDTDSEQIASRIQSAGIGQKQLVQGLRIPGVWDCYEAGCRAILGQQISVVAAVKLVSQLTLELGKTSESVSSNGAVGRYFPEPEAIVHSALDFLAMPGTRKEALRSFAQIFTADSSSRQTLNQQEWLSIKGVGPWTLSYASLRGLSEPDIWLSTDGVIKKVLQNHSIDADNAAPWRSYLTLNLWSMA